MSRIMLKYAGEYGGHMCRMVPAE